MARMTAWSYSRWRDYDDCPQKAKFKYVDKIKEPENDAMANGSACHDTAAAYLRADLPVNEPIPGWTYFEQLYRQLRELEPLVEQEWGFTSDWKPTGWFGNDTWFRSKLDSAVVYDDGSADVIDIKTGKPRPDQTAQQGELYAVSIFCRYPAVQLVTVRFWYIDLAQAGKEEVYRFSRDMAAGIIERWTKRAKRMLSDERMVPRPGTGCKWCFYAKSNNGNCKYG
ncbi:MAG: PD-(D/E)XK nuclease family protein [Pigmentiphaga sp.]|nr:PD-(D/E)XK nuclease family protein [Pigmentiphaga sp.]